nr:MAG TPA: hypothetical protein [Caudoviricetes sp.]
MSLCLILNVFRYFLYIYFLSKFIQILWRCCKIVVKSSHQIVRFFLTFFIFFQKSIDKYRTV